MNLTGIAILILIIIAADALLHATADFLNVKSFKNKIPDGFKEFYDPGEYAKARRYLQATTRFGQFSSLFDVALLLGFWFLGGFDILDQHVRGFGLNPVFTGVAYITILLLFKFVLDLPFSIYSTFIIEEKFGFNKTTAKTFVTDMIKGAALFLILGVPLISGVFAFFEYAGPRAWLYCWGAVTAFMLFIQYIFPSWIMPMFNKFQPLEDGPLKEAAFAHAKAVQFPLQHIFVMDGSKRSSKSNAFFTGFFKKKRIVLYDTLMKNHGVDEIVAILAHEIGHYKKKHILKSMVISVANTGLMFFLLSVCLSRQWLFDAFFMEQASVYAGIIFFSLLYSPLEFFIQIFVMIYSRKNEYEADEFAMAATGDGQSLALALKKLSVSNLSNLTPHPFYVFLNYSHPPVLERVKRLDPLQGGA